VVKGELLIMEFCNSKTSAAASYALLWVLGLINE
jgi:hypothetical protein